LQRHHAIIANSLKFCPGALFFTKVFRPRSR